MDVFQTIVTSGELIYKFLDAYSAHSNEARSLAARFKWDIRVLQQIVQHFESERLLSHGKLGNSDQQLLQETAEYLQGLAARVNTSCARVQTTEWLSRTTNKVLWFHRRKELQSLEQELFEWTSRFDIRLVGLPPELKAVITPAIGGEDAGPGTGKALCSNWRMHRIQTIAEDARQAESANLFLDEVPDTLRQPPRQAGDSEHSILQFNGQPVILESRYFPVTDKDDPGPDSLDYRLLKADVGRFASALNAIDNNVVSLLRCTGYFHNPSPSRPSFNLIHALPFPSSTAPTLKTLIAAESNGKRLPPLHPLDQRYRVALNLTTALLFLHGADYLHKNISTNAILLLTPSGGPSFPHSLGTPYLVNFALIRSFSLASHPMIMACPTDWRELVYMHPARHGPRPRGYVRAYDVYSLGVVLLELGLWRPLERFERELRGKEGEGMRAALVRVAEEVGITMGARYQGVVKWCLGVDAEDDVRPAVLVREVLAKLEDIVEAVR